MPLIERVIGLFAMLFHAIRSFLS